MGVKLFDVRWHSTTGGPSPVNNERTELFFAGCKIAAAGHPCPGCFNPRLWHIPEGCEDRDPKDMAEHIRKFSPTPYITIVGGEPFDQPEGLLALCEELHERGFHILVFTHYELKNFQNEDWSKDMLTDLWKNIDILIDGPYKKDEHIYDANNKDGFNNVVGSGNQIVWDCNSYRGKAANKLTGYYTRDLATVKVTPSFNTVYFLKNPVQPEVLT